MDTRTLAPTVDKERLLAIVQTILREPTAPFHEARVRQAIVGLLRPCRGVTLREDDFGNLIAHYRGGEGASPSARYAFCAHMDHPGWVRPEPAASDEPWRFLGGVPADYLEANRERVQSFGDFAMWDLPDYELRDGRIHSRACDDLIGCAVIVATLERLAGENVPGECYGLFTRGEEVGFAGAIEMARDGWLAAEGLTVISLETSAERPPARMGDGPIVRVGDKTSMFDPGVTAELVAAATASGVASQRCLMSGGTCEATPFRLYGVRCGALCVALGNYHNCGPDRRIEAEYVSQSDFEGLVELCVQIARRGAAGSPDPDAELRAHLETRLQQYQPFHRRDRQLPTDP